MDIDVRSATVILSALRIALEHGSAAKALEAAGIKLAESERIDGLSNELEDLIGASAAEGPASEALALGFLAGRVAPRRRRREEGDPTSFVMDRHLVVQGAEGESILRLPWFEEELFVGRQLREIAEMPSPIRKLAVEKYSAALNGEAGEFAFTSYGHSYRVQAVPVLADDDSVETVLAIATPAHSYASAVAAYEGIAERMVAAAACAERRSKYFARSGDDDAEATERQSTHRYLGAAERARTNADRLRSQIDGSGAPPAVTSRESEILSLASHGLSYADIADQLALSPETVKAHFHNMYSKLGVRDKAAAVAVALRHGLIE
jgi:DNA-binding NarL/FixJ family response regulator